MFKGRVKPASVVFALTGAGLLIWVISGIDLDAAAAQIGRVGWGLAAIVGIYFVAFYIDSISWLLTIRSVPLSGRWMHRIWMLRMIGEAVNSSTPAGFAGEPVKSVLLKTHHGIGYRESAASIILARTINMLALLVFLGGGLLLMLRSPDFSSAVKTVSAIGFGAVTIGFVGFFLLQRVRAFGALGERLAALPPFRRLQDTLHHIHDLDDRLVEFYTRRKTRFAAALGLAFVNWLLGVVEIYLIMAWLGYPVSWAEAWTIEAVAQMVRTGTFFIPASIGAQEGAFVLVSTAITGSPTPGFSAGIVRRVREVIWIAWGFLLSFYYSGGRSKVSGDKV